MSLKNRIGWLLVAVSIAMALESIWHAIFTYDQMGYFAILLGMSMFIGGALLTRRQGRIEGAHEIEDLRIYKYEHDTLPPRSASGINWQGTEAQRVRAFDTERE